MALGACSGSTSGGIKSIRGLMLLKIVRNEFRQILHPNAVLPLKIEGVNVPQSKRVTLLAFVTLYILLTIVCAFARISSAERALSPSSRVMDAMASGMSAGV